MIHHTEFVCTCNPKGRRQARNLMRRVKGKLDATDANLLSCIVMDLAWTHRAGITMVGSDQWFGVSAEGQRILADGKAEPDVLMWVQADQVEHAFAAIWRAFENLKRNGRTTRGA